MRFQALSQKVRSSKPLRLFVKFGWILLIIWMTVNLVTNRNPNPGISGGISIVLFVLIGFAFLWSTARSIATVIFWLLAAFLFVKGSYFPASSGESVVYVMGEQTTVEKGFWAVWPFRKVEPVTMEYNVWLPFHATTADGKEIKGIVSALLELDLREPDRIVHLATVSDHDQTTRNFVRALIIKKVKEEISGLKISEIFPTTIINGERPRMVISTTKGEFTMDLGKDPRVRQQLSDLCLTSDVTVRGNYLRMVH